MPKPEPVLGNGHHKILYDFEIQMDNLILDGRPDLVLITKKKTWPLLDFNVPARHKLKIKEREKIEKYLDLVRKPRKM